MNVAVKAALRNGLLLRWRTERSLTQADAAGMAGISLARWGAVECMDFRAVPWHAIEKIATLIEVLADDICPQELYRKNCGLKRVAYAEIPHERLLPIGKEAMMLPAPEPPVDVASLNDALMKILKTLTYREREIVKRRHGLDCEPATLRETAAMFGITKERVRQVEARAIRKLQHPVREKKLREMLGESVGAVVPIDDIDQNAG